MSDFRILAVDDDQIIQKILEFTLEAEGYQVRLAANGNEAVEALHVERFDLVITDIEMGEPDGFAILRTAKNLNPLTGRIVISGNQDISSIIKAIRIGVDGYFVKPFSPSELVVRVRESIDNVKMKRKAAIKVSSIGKTVILGDKVQLKAVLKYFLKRHKKWR